MKNRKQLPNFFKLTKTVDMDAMMEWVRANDILNHRDSDINYSTSRNHRSFLVANHFNKESFFKEDGAQWLEGDLYKQVYLTEIDESKLTTSENDLLSSGNTIFGRVKRLNKSRKEYIPEADELNYCLRNSLVNGYMESFLDSFKSKVLRVRIATLSPGFSIKPHVDYDPSYITRYHIPIVTNSGAIMGVINNDKTEETIHMEADGSIYFLNTGKLHFAKNGGNAPRVHLIVDVHGQSDLI